VSQGRRGGITRLGRQAGAIVNAANESLFMGGGVCGTAAERWSAERESRSVRE
jgi:O-acetyl-ADP-ribose deacetylase (regulator of RNase III)